MSVIINTLNIHFIFQCKKILELSFKSTERVIAIDFTRECVPCLRIRDGRIKIRPGCFGLRNLHVVSISKGVRILILHEILEKN